MCVCVCVCVCVQIAAQRVHLRRDKEAAAGTKHTNARRTTRSTRPVPFAAIRTDSSTVRQFVEISEEICFETTLLFKDHL